MTILVKISWGEGFGFSGHEHGAADDRVISNQPAVWDLGRQSLIDQRNA